VYLSTPDHKEIGSVLKAKYTKDFKEKLNNLGREEVLEYLKSGKVNINGYDIFEGQLKIAKQFNQKYASNEGLGCDSSLDMSVMLDMVIDDNLKQKGMAREIVNKVQKLRKSAGLNIDDHVEIFYKVSQVGLLTSVVNENLDTIRASLKTAFLCADSHHQPQFIKIAETEYANPENESELITLTICSPNVSFDFVKLTAKYGHLNTEKVNFVNDVKSFVYAHSQEALRKKVDTGAGKLRFRLNDQDVELTLREDFYYSALDLSKRSTD